MTWVYIKTEGRLSNCERAEMIKGLRECADKLERGETVVRAPGGGKTN